MSLWQGSLSRCHQGHAEAKMCTGSAGESIRWQAGHPLGPGLSTPGLQASTGDSAEGSGGSISARAWMRTGRQGGSESSRTTQGYRRRAGCQAVSMDTTHVWGQVLWP